MNRSDTILRLDDIEIECPQVYGLATPLKAYKLAWRIQQLPYFNCQKCNDSPNYVNKGEHTTYDLDDLDHDARILMVKNKGTEGFFYTKYKEMDYLLFCVHPFPDIDNDSLTLIAELSDVSLCLQLNEVPEPDRMNFIQLL